MADVALARQQLIDLGQIGVEAQDLITSVNKSSSKRQPDVAKTDDSHERRLVGDLGFKLRHRQK